MELSIDRHKMKRGESSPVQLRLTGFNKEMKGHLVVTLRIDNPGVATFANGQGTITLTIAPQDLQEDGTYTRTVAVLALNPGAYTVAGTLTEVPVDD